MITPAWLAMVYDPSLSAVERVSRAAGHAPVEAWATQSLRQFVARMRRRIEAPPRARRVEISTPIDPPIPPPRRALRLVRKP